MGKKGSGERSVLIYDMGGDTFDVPLLMIEKSVWAESAFQRPQHQ